MSTTPRRISDLLRELHDAAEEIGADVDVVLKPRTSSGTPLPQLPLLEPSENHLPIDVVFDKCRLCRIERVIVRVLLASPTRQTTHDLHDLVEAHMKDAVAEGQLKLLLARMVEVGVLDNVSCRPRGYGVAPAFLAIMHTPDSN